MKQLFSLFLISLCALPLGACGQSTKEALGLTKTTPDEFSVVSRAPLSIPPDYALRPPKPGQKRPMEISTRDSARQTVFGKEDLPSAGSTQPSGSFMDKVGASNADSNIRQILDAESAENIEDNRPVAEKVMFWRDGESEEKGTPIDPKEELERLKEEGVVTIKKRNEDIEAP